MEPTVISSLQVRLAASPGSRGTGRAPRQVDGRAWSRGPERLDPLVIRLRISSLLNRLDLSRVGLGPSAVLCIRRLVDPLPGEIVLDPGGILPAAWESAVQQALGRLAQQAARPVREPVPAAANAVLFADQAELLACLGSDWCRGEVSERWWWRSWLEKQDAAQAVWGAWRAAPEYVPGALAYLSGLGQSNPRGLVTPAQFVQRLGVAASQELLEGVLRRFNLERLSAALSTSGSPAVGSYPIEDQPGGTAGEDIRLSAPFPPAPFPFGNPEAGSSTRSESGWAASPWQALEADGKVPPGSVSQPGLEKVQQTLIGVGLGLVIQPQEVRSAAFARSVVIWWRSPEERSSDSGAWPAEPRRRSSGSRPGDDGSSTHGMDTGSALVQSRPGPLAGQAPLEEQGRPEAAQGPEQMPVWRAGTPHPGPMPDVEAGAFSPGFPRSESSFPYQPWDNFTGEIAEDDGAQLETRLGGFFYLVNLGLYLGLYGDFSAPQLPGLELNLWDFVTLLGRALLGRQTDGFADDPVWGLLARLAGRGFLHGKSGEQGSPGESFHPPEAWRLPVAWLSEPLLKEPRPWVWRAAAGRLQIVHPLGFYAVDLPLEVGDPETLLAEEMARFGGFGGGIQVIPQTTGPWLADGGPGAAGIAPGWELPLPLARWLNWVAGYARVRLAFALGKDEPGLAESLLIFPARLRLTSTHLEVFLSLDRLPVALRLSGLDRDPGWVPAAGRYIRFIYE